MTENARTAIEGLDPDDLAPRDHACCGNSGWIEAFLRAEDYLDAPEYRTDAMRLAANTVNRANKNGRYVTPWSSERWHNPTFFTGEAGVGYSFMRILDPDLPSVLALK